MTSGVAETEVDEIEARCLSLILTKICSQYDFFMQHPVAAIKCLKPMSKACYIKYSPASFKILSCKLN